MEPQNKQTFHHLDQISLHGFHGGICPPEHKLPSKENHIHELNMNDYRQCSFQYPLMTSRGKALMAKVKVGDSVLSGQQLIFDESGSIPPQHSAISGKVLGIEDRTLNHPSGILVPHLLIEPDQNNLSVEFNAQDLDTLLSTSADELIQILFEKGVVGMGGAGFPTATKLSSSIKSNSNLETLIINGAECEPYISCDDGMMTHDSEKLLQGCKLLSHILKVKKILIVVEDNKTAAILKLKETRDRLQLPAGIVTIPTKYPSGGEKQLIENVTGIEVPAGGYPAQIGIVVQNVATVLACYDALVNGRPCMERVVTLTGKAVINKGNYLVPIGISVRSLLEIAGWQKSSTSKVILGGPMMGETISDLDVAISKTSNCIIAATSDEIPVTPNSMPCIRCGHCAQVCPARLLPQQLYWFAKSDQFEKAQHHHLTDCIECGACAWVCPSHLPLVDFYRYAKQGLADQIHQQSQIELSRIRHEKKLQRLEFQQQQKAARRKQKAEEAKRRKLQRQQEDGFSDEEKRNSIESALERVKAKKAAAAEKYQTSQSETSDNNNE